MATRRKGNTIEHPSIKDVFPEELPVNPAMIPAVPGADTGYDDIDEYDDVTALNTVLSELGADGAAGGGGFITVFKEFTVNGTKSEKYMGRHAVVDFSTGNLLEHLKNTFGGGRYHIRVYYPNGKGLAANKLIDIEGDTVNVPAVVPGAHPVVDLSPLTAQLTQMQSNFEKLLGALAGTQPKQPSRIEMLEEMKMLTDMFKPTVPVTPSPSYNPVDMMKLGMEMASMNSGDNNNMWVSKMIDVFGKPIIDALMMQKVAGDTSRQARIPAQPAGKSVISSAPVNEPESENDAVSLMLKGYLKLLENAAAQNQDVSEYADSILNMLPETQLTEFEEMLRAPDWKDRFAKYSQGVLKHPDWFTALHDKLLEYIDEDKQHLTPEVTGASVPAHETGDPGKSTTDDNTGSAA